MFNQKYMRKIIACIWIIGFILLWAIFNRILPRHSILTKLDEIEENVQREDWEKARISVDELNKIYNDKKFIIQVNNATEAFITFNYTLGQLEYSVKHEQKTALEYIGTLRYSLDYVIKAFSGP